MPRTIRIPWLHDRHSHASFYASLTGCQSLAGLSPQEAVAAMRTLPADQLSMVFGWHSARMPLDPETLRDLPPAIIVNVSMHGYTLSEPAAERLQATQPEVVAHRSDADARRNLRIDDRRRQDAVLAGRLPGADDQRGSGADEIVGRHQLLGSDFADTPTRCGICGTGGAAGSVRLCRVVRLAPVDSLSRLPTRSLVRASGWLIG